MRRSSNHNQNEVSFGYQSMQPSFHKTAVTQFHQKEISYDRPPRSNFARRLVSSEAHDPENVPTQHTATSIISREPPRRMDFSHQQPLMAADMHVLNLTSKPSFTRVLPQQRPPSIEFKRNPTAKIYSSDVPQPLPQTDQSVIESQKSLNTSHISEKPNTVKLRTDLLNTKNSLEEEKELNKQNSKTIEDLNQKINSLE